VPPQPGGHPRARGLRPVPLARRGRVDGNLGPTLPADGVPIGRAFLVELLVAFLLVLVVIAVATDDRAESGIARSRWVWPWPRPSSRPGRSPGAR